MAKPNKGLGRGLDALLTGSVTGGVGGSEDVLRELNVTRLKAGEYQPRIGMDEAALSELAASIKEQGVMQPILVRALPDGDYEIIAGHRRWRAAQQAGLDVVPVLVRKVEDKDALAMALIENIQRENLNPLEEATGIQRLIEEFDMTHQAAADAVGRSRSAASNLLRLLKLPQPVQDMLMDGRLDMGHARALLALDGASQITAANKIIAAGWSVREAEKLVQDMLNPPAIKEKSPINRDVIQLQDRVADNLGAKVTIKHGAKGAGKLVIEYQSTDQLDGILAKMGIEN